MSACFPLPAELNIYNVISIREALLAWVDQLEDPSGELQVSASDVAEVDGAGLQLLAALTNSGLVWRVVDASDSFIEACRTMGFSQWIDGAPTGRTKGMA